MLRIHLQEVRFFIIGQEEGFGGQPIHLHEKHEHHTDFDDRSVNTHFAHRTFRYEVFDHLGYMNSLAVPAMPLTISGSE